MPRELPANTRRRRWMVVIIVGFVLMMAMILSGSRHGKSDQYISIKLEGFRTNANGLAETILTFRNEADDLRIEPHVTFAVDGRYQPFSTAAVQDAKGAWITTFMDGGSNMLFVVRSWTNANFEIKSSAGFELSIGQKAELTFPKPTNSFNVIIDCWRAKPPPRSKVFQQVARMNQWASSKWGFPVLIPDSYWMHFQVALPAYPAVPLEGRDPPSTFFIEREYRP